MNFHLYLYFFLLLSLQILIKIFVFFSSYELSFCIFQGDFFIVSFLTSSFLQSFFFFSFPPTGSRSAWPLWRHKNVYGWNSRIFLGGRLIILFFFSLFSFFSCSFSLSYPARQVGHCEDVLEEFLVTRWWKRGQHSVMYCFGSVPAP